MQAPAHIDEYNIQQNFNWKKFPLEENKLSILIIYNDNTKQEMERLVNKLLFVFPDRCYYDDETNNWIKLPPDTNGYRVPFLDKILICKNDKTNKSTLIINSDNLLLEDPNHYEYKVLDNKVIDNKSNEITPIDNMILNKLERDTKIFRILDNRTFITHVICTANINNVLKSYYEKFDIMFFTTMDIANTFTSTRTYRQFGIEKMPQNMIFMTDLREMKNNLCLYPI